MAAEQYPGSQLLRHQLNQVSPQALFDRIDQNHDGVLSREEFANFQDDLHPSVATFQEALRRQIHDQLGGASSSDGAAIARIGATAEQQEQQQQLQQLRQQPQQQQQQQLELHRTQQQQQQLQQQLLLQQQQQLLLQQQQQQLLIQQQQQQQQQLPPSARIIPPEICSQPPATTPMQAIAEQQPRQLPLQQQLQQLQQQLQQPQQWQQQQPQQQLPPSARIISTEISAHQLATAPMQGAPMSTESTSLKTTVTGEIKYVQEMLPPAPPAEPIGPPVILQAPGTNQQMASPATAQGLKMQAAAQQVVQSEAAVAKHLQQQLQNLQSSSQKPAPIQLQLPRTQQEISIPPGVNPLQVMMQHQQQQQQQLAEMQQDMSQLKRMFMATMQIMQESQEQGAQAEIAEQHRLFAGVSQDLQDQSNGFSRPPEPLSSQQNFHLQPLHARRIVGPAGAPEGPQDLAPASSGSQPPNAAAYSRANQLTVVRSQATDEQPQKAHDALDLDREQKLQHVRRIVASLPGTSQDGQHYGNGVSNPYLPVRSHQRTSSGGTLPPGSLDERERDESLLLPNPSTSKESQDPADNASGSHNWIKQDWSLDDRYVEHASLQPASKGTFHDESLNGHAVPTLPVAREDKRGEGCSMM